MAFTSYVRVLLLSFYDAVSVVFAPIVYGVLAICVNLADTRLNV